jgi:hypothetical protein
MEMGFASVALAGIAVLSAWSQTPVKLKRAPVATSICANKLVGLVSMVRLDFALGQPTFCLCIQCRQFRSACWRPPFSLQQFNQAAFLGFGTAFGSSLLWEGPPSPIYGY